MSWHIVETRSRVTNKMEMSHLALAVPLGVSGSVLSSWLLFHVAACTNGFSTSTENKKGHLVSQFKGKEEVGV